MRLYICYQKRKEKATVATVKKLQIKPNEKSNPLSISIKNKALRDKNRINRLISCFKTIDYKSFFFTLKTFNNENLRLIGGS